MWAVHDSLAKSFEPSTTADIEEFVGIRTLHRPIMRVRRTRMLDTCGTVCPGVAAGRQAP